MQQRYFRKKSWESSWQLYDRMKRESKSDVVMLVPADFLDGVFLRLCWHDKRRAIDETVFAIAVFFFFFIKNSIFRRNFLYRAICYISLIRNVFQKCDPLILVKFDIHWYIDWPVQSMIVEYLKEWFWKRNIYYIIIS